MRFACAGAVRAQVHPDVYKHFAAVRGRVTEGVEKTKQDNRDKVSLFVQEIAVDSLRCALSHKPPLHTTRYSSVTELALALLFAGTRIGLSPWC